MRLTGHPSNKMPKTFKKVKDEMIRIYKSTEVKSEDKNKRKPPSWRAVSRLTGISQGTLIRISKGYEPRSTKIRSQLGLSNFYTVEACKKCGKLHDTIKTCPDKRKKPIRHSDKKLINMPSDVLRWKLINREIR